MQKYVLDSSALLRFADDEAGGNAVERMFLESQGGRCELLMSAVNWGEVIYATAKSHGAVGVDKLKAHIGSMPLQIVAAGPSEAEAAGLLRHEFNVPYADAFAGSLAIREGAILVTADFDFKALPSGTLKIEFLPRKPRPN